MTNIGTQSELVFRSKVTAPLPITTIDGNLKYLEIYSNLTSQNLPYQLFGINSPIPPFSSFESQAVASFQARSVTFSTPSLKKGNRISFVFDGSYLNFENDSGGTNADYFWYSLRENVSQPSKDTILNVQSYHLPQFGPIWGFKVLNITLSNNNIPNAPSTFSWFLETVVVSGPTANGFNDPNVLPAINGRFLISYKTEGQVISSGNGYTSTDNFILEEGQFNLSFLYSDEVFANLIVNAFEGGVGTSWIFELKGLFESGIPQALYVSAVDDTSNVLIFNIEFISEVVNSTITIFGKVISQNGEIYNNTIYNLKYIPKVNTSIGVGLIPSNGSFWRFQGTSQSFSGLTVGQFSNRGLNDTVLVGESYIFDFSQRDNTIDNLDYSMWLDHLYVYGDSGNSILHLTEYSQTNNTPTSSSISKGNFVIESFNGTSSSMNVKCLSGQGQLSDIGLDAQVKPVDYFISYTLVPSTGTGGGGGSGITGPAGVTGPSSTIIVDRGFNPFEIPFTYDYSIIASFEGPIVSLVLHSKDEFGMTLSNFIFIKNLIDLGYAPLINLVKVDDSTKYLSFRSTLYNEATTTFEFSGPLSKQNSVIDFFDKAYLSYYLFPVVYEPVPLLNVNGSFWNFIGATTSGLTVSNGEFKNVGDKSIIERGATYTFVFSQSDTNDDYSSWFDNLYVNGNSGNSQIHLIEYDKQNLNPTNSVVAKGDFRITSFNATSSSMNVVCINGVGELIDLAIDGSTEIPKLFYVSNSLVPVGSGGQPGSTREDTFTSVTSSVVVHNFGFYPQVQIFDSNGEIFIPLKILHTSTASFTVEFSSITSGTIISIGSGPQGFQGPSGLTGGVGATGITGPQGATGPQGSDGRTVINQDFGTVSSIIFTHSFGNYPIVDIINSSGVKITPSSYTVSHGNTNSFVVDFSSPTSGILLVGGGLTGPQGSIGPQGFTGTTGVQGPTGVQGRTGPQGFQGRTGPQGSQGFIGTTGPQGDIGTIGDQGPTGIQGVTGPQGVTGSQGFTGFQGTTGPQGFTGFQGTTGPQGFTGFQGPTGPQGFQGMTGPIGANAKSTLVTNFSTASVVTVTHSFGGYPLVQAINSSGFKINSTSYSIFYGSTNSFEITFGTTFSGSIITGGGLTGPQGTQGTQGTTGFQGVTGPQGFQGRTGPQGFTGIQGTTGPQGFQGRTGPIGTTGVQGPTGSQGRTGSTGPQGITGFSFIWRDSWTASTTYSLYNVVRFQGSSWISLGTSSPGVTPSVSTQSWSLLSSIGNTGPQGVTGVQGFTGVQGNTGPQGSTGGTGPQGPTGLIGPTGIKGSTGTRGLTGTTGFQGSTGPQGFTGPKGSDANTTILTDFATSSVVTVTHSFGGFPIVQAIDSSGYKINSSSYSIFYGTTNSYIITFNSTYSGSILTGGGVTGPQGPLGPQGVSGPTGSMGPTGAGGAVGYYLSGYSINEQTNLSITQSNIARFGITTDSSGISVNQGTVSFGYSGTYNVNFFGQFFKVTPSTDEVEIWIRRNGANVEYTSSKFTVQQSNISESVSCNWLLNLNANDVIEILWYSNEPQMKLVTTGTQSNPNRPTIPSCSIKVQQIMYLQTGPTGIQGPTGPQGTSFDWNGDYSDTFTYSLGDVVYYQGSSYISITSSNIGLLPDSSTISWEVLALKGDTGLDSQKIGNYGDGLGYLINYGVGTFSIPTNPGEIFIQLYSTSTMSVGATQTIYFYNIDYDLVNRYELFYPILLTNQGIRKNTLRLVGDINNDFRVDTINYNNTYWVINTTVTSGTTSMSGLFSNTRVSYIQTISPTGSMIITSNVVPTYSASVGNFGEVRLGLSGSIPNLYVYTDQWYRFLGATF